jgi:radical SAM protein with 4Fe4S-binding SPASM domain
MPDSNYYKNTEDRKRKVKEWMAQPGNNFCALPFIHMAIEANGQVRPCCMGDPFDNINVTGNTIEKVYNHPERQEFVQAFKDNKQHPKCNVCWNAPYSIRSRYSSNDMSIAFTESVMMGNTPEASLQWLEIKPGNRCNLKCRICGIHNSSTWTKDHYILKENKNIKFKDSFAFNYTQQCNWVDDPNFWNDVTQLDEIRDLHFMGGEPFMVLEHFQLLEKLVASRDCSDITIRYNTNGTYYPTDEQWKLYTNFKHVKFQISIDDVAQRFEYQRKEAKWDQVKENLKKFKAVKLLSNSLKGKLQLGALVDPTVNTLNIFYLDTIEKQFKELGYPLGSHADHFVFSGIHDIRNLPTNIKHVINEKYKDSDSKWTPAVLDYMWTKNQDPEQWKLFIKITKRLDKIRNESFKDVFPEFYNLLKDDFERYTIE